VTVTGADLRALVREVVRDAVADLATPARPTNGHSTFRPAAPLTAEEKARVDTVRIATDADLDAFV